MSTSVLVDRDGPFLVLTLSGSSGQSATVKFDRKNARDVINAMETVLRGMVDAPYVVNDLPGPLATGPSSPSTSTSDGT